MTATRAMVAYADHLQNEGLGAATIYPKLSALTGYRRGVELGLNVIAGAGDLEHAEHERDRVLCPLRSDEPERRHRTRPSLAKKTAADLHRKRRNSSPS